MAESKDRPKSLTKRFGRWLLKARAVESKERVAKEGQPVQHSRWQVMCLTGVKLRSWWLGAYEFPRRPLLETVWKFG